MRIGVVSDSHGDLYMLEKAIRMMGEVEYIVHLGDHYRDSVKVCTKLGYKTYYVSGNNDYTGIDAADKVLECNGKRILLTHGHKYGVGFGIMNLYYKAVEEKVDIVLYGHTHRYELDYEGDIFFLNPGSVARPRDGSPSAAILVIENKGDIYAEKLVIG